MSDSPQTGLKRSLGAFDVVALGLNGVIGTGIFLLPGDAAAAAGPAAILATLLAGALCFAIALCFADAGSRFTGTGGPYLYAREAFGDGIGFAVGWMTACVRVISWAALSAGFASALGAFYAPAREQPVSGLIAAGLIAGLALLNFYGAKLGALITNVFTVAKLIPLLLFASVGMAFIDTSNYTPFAPHGYATLGETTLLILFAFVGFECLAVPAGEMRDPKRAVPLAFVAVLSIVTAVYAAVLLVAFGTLPDVAQSGSPVVDAARTFLGDVGADVVGLGILVSVLGINAGSALVTPRCVYALAEKRQLPSAVARLHPEHGTPHVAIVLSAVLAIGLALSGSFKQLALMSVVARFAQYIPTCVAVLVFRHRRREQDPDAGFRAPFGPVVPLLATGASVWLLVNAETENLLAGAIALAAGLPFYLWSRRAKAAGGVELPRE